MYNIICLFTNLYSVSCCSKTWKCKRPNRVETTKLSIRRIHICTMHAHMNFFPFIFDSVLSTYDVVSPLRSENSSSQRWQFEDTRHICAHGNYNFRCSNCGSMLVSMNIIINNRLEFVLKAHCTPLCSVYIYVEALSMHRYRDAVSKLCRSAFK